MLKSGDSVFIMFRAAACQETSLVWLSWHEIERILGNLCTGTEYECVQHQILTDLCCLVLCICDLFVC